MFADDFAEMAQTAACNADYLIKGNKTRPRRIEEWRKANHLTIDEANALFEGMYANKDIRIDYSDVSIHELPDAPVAIRASYFRDTLRHIEDSQPSGVFDTKTGKGIGAIRFAYLPDVITALAMFKAYNMNNAPEEIRNSNMDAFSKASAVRLAEQARTLAAAMDESLAFNVAKNPELKDALAAGDKAINEYLAAFKAHQESMTLALELNYGDHRKKAAFKKIEAKVKTDCDAYFAETVTAANGATYSADVRFSRIFGAPGAVQAYALYSYGSEKQAAGLGAKLMLGGAPLNPDAFVKQYVFKALAEALPDETEEQFREGSPIKGGGFNRPGDWSNDIRDGSSRGTVTSIKDDNGLVKITFKKETFKNPLEKCTDTNKIWGIDFDTGKIIYYQNCVSAGFETLDVTPEPIRVTKQHAKGVKIGNVLHFAAAKDGVAAITEAFANKDAKTPFLAMGFAVGGK